MSKLFQHISLLSLILLVTLTTQGNSSAFADTSNRLTLKMFSSNGPNHFLVVDKSRQKLALYQHDTSVRLLQTFTCATGENPGKKLFSGDSRTPEGVYFITEIYEDKKITVFGSRAFHLNYPNVFDQHSGHLGDGIFIHGTNKTLIPFSTNGCITLDNNDLDLLAPYLTINSVPVIIVNKMEDSVLNNMVSLERDGQEFDEILALLELNSPQFEKENIRTISFLTAGSQTIASIAYKVFDSNSMQYLYKKRVYLSPTEDNRWRSIHAIHYQEIIPKILAISPVKHKHIAQIEQEKKKEPTAAASRLQRANELLKFVEKWRKAWSSKDIETYMSCYSPTFKNGKLSYAGWKKKKSYLNKKYEFIQVTIHNIVVEWTNTGANVSFFQSYQSDKYQTSGKKMLKLVHDDIGWLIQAEIM